MKSLDYPIIEMQKKMKGQQMFFVKISVAKNLSYMSTIKFSVPKFAFLQFIIFSDFIYSEF